MTSVIYPKGKENLGAANVNMTSNTIKVQPVDLADYTYSAAHDAFDDIPAGARVGTATAIANKSFTNGVFDGDDTFIAGVTGDQFEALVIYKDSGTESTSWLLAFIDSATGLPFTPSGGGVTINWDNGANKIFAL